MGAAAYSQFTGDAVAQWVFQAVIFLTLWCVPKMLVNMPQKSARCLWATKICKHAINLVQHLFEVEMLLPRHSFAIFMKRKGLDIGIRPRCSKLYVTVLINR